MLSKFSEFDYGVPLRYQHLRSQTLKVLSARNWYNWRDDPYHSLSPPEGGCSGPVYTSIMYGFTKAEEAAAVFNGKPGYAYPRIACGTPPVYQLSKKLLDLELGNSSHKDDYDVLLTSSGMSAILATILTFNRAGDYFLSSSYLYGGTYDLFVNFLPTLGIKSVLIDDQEMLTDPDLNVWLWQSHSCHLRPLPTAPTCIFAEDDANPMLIKLDNQRLAAVAHELKALYVCDRTIGTPILEKPLAVFKSNERPDLVIHSLSKNISGHSWGLGGAIIGRRELIEKIRDGWFVVMGCVLDSRVADRILVGMDDLEDRMKMKISSVGVINDWLQNHDAVEKIYGPRSDMISFELRGDLGTAQKWAESLGLVVFGPHLGDIQTLVIHPASTTHARVPEEKRKRLGISDTLIRVSVGLEDPLDIIDDFDQAFKNMKRDK